MKSERLIYGIQQIGIGVADIHIAENWYVSVLKANIKILEDNRPALHMAPYMGGEARSKVAILLINENGGGGFELWQHTGRMPMSSVTRLKSGDLGINYIVVHTSSFRAVEKHLSVRGVRFSYQSKQIQFADPFGNQIRVKEAPFSKPVLFTGVKGCAIGVSDLKQSIEFYHKLGFVKKSEITENTIQQSTLLSDHNKGRMGTFLGESELTLIKRLDGNAIPIYQNRFWGDPGYIHLCLDVFNLPSWVVYCKQIGFPFTVLSDVNFRMGDAQGHWGYLEDPDHTLIEMVETHKIPLIKSLCLNINLTRRSPRKPIPLILLKALSLKRVHR